jgi:surfeit locus 1 family protein
LLAISGCAAGVALGNWQSRRADQRHAAEARLEAASRAPALEIASPPGPAATYVGKRVAAGGEFVRAHTVLLEHKIRHGRLGYEVVTPLRLHGSALHVAVNRGWIPADPRPGVLPEVRTPSGELRIEGLALERLPQALQAGTARERGKVLQNFRVEEFQSATGLTLLPLVIEQWSEVDDGLAREWPRPGAGAEKNEMYALQWYSLAALSVVLFVVLSFRNDRSAIS